MREKEIENFLKDAEQFNICLSQQQVDQFVRYYELLVEWNSFMNLTGITEFSEVLKKHFIDSISLFSYVNQNSISSLIDVGTGAGFPGLPLKIVCPELKVTLLDSLDKRIKFLNCVIDELELQNITAIHGRAEDYASNMEHREFYDMAVSRAVANLSTLSEYCLPFVKKDGIFVSYKSETLEEEVINATNAIQILGGRIMNKYSFYLPGTDIYRTLCFIEKVDSTPDKYPRKAGLPSKKPL